MLTELRIQNLAIIDHLILNFGPGLNILTGETGAGKSIIIDAVNLLLGDRASVELVRAGADRTEVEGTFQLSPATAARVTPLLAAHSLEGDQPDVLVLAREVRANGRSVARVNGRVVTTALLAEIGELLVDVHGQGEHLSLLREREHIGLLDRYAGLGDQVAAMADLVRRVRQIRRELEALRQDERERARRIDLLAYQVEEIRSARLKPGEEEELEAERRRLANAEQLAALSNEVVTALSGGDEEMAGALDALGAAEQALTRLARLDPSAAPLAEQLSEASALVDDLAREMTHYRDNIEFNPRRLQQVEDRLHLIHSLERKYGDTIEDVLAYATRAAAELETISHAEERIGELEAQEVALLAEIGRAGAALSAARRAAAERMARAIEAELADLQMARARFAVDITWTPDPAGAIVDAAAAAMVSQAPGRYAFDQTGLDTVAFLVSANPGEPLKPMARVASGGETSRLMLALKAVLGRADETPTLIFDEIDQGIGGRVGATVGRKLWELTQRNGGERGEDEGRKGPGKEGLLRPETGIQHPVISHQVLCITHLPQLAAYGDVHFRVAKHQVGQRTVTEVRSLSGDERLTELASMLGADSEAGRASVAEMVAEVTAYKRQKG
ncbi:MAG: DNA repair protein RecN [Anaerolineae bacterium]|nr:DNA repair protein RecN [Anaerolineae bacterium]